MQQKRTLLFVEIDFNFCPLLTKSDLRIVNFFRLNKQRDLANLKGAVLELLFTPTPKTEFLCHFRHFVHLPACAGQNNIPANETGYGLWADNLALRSAEPVLDSR
jgi:hypothetical protein